MFVFFFKQKTAYEMRISDWSSDVCSSDLFVQYTAQAAEENAAFPLRADKSSPLKRHPPLRECIGSSSMQSSFLPRKGVSYVASGLVMAAIALMPADAAAGND